MTSAEEVIFARKDAEAAKRRRKVGICPTGGMLPNASFADFTISVPEGQIEEILRPET